MKNNRSIERCLLLFQKFRVNPCPTVSELARLTELPRATVMRFLLTLEGEGYVKREHERWRLTAKVLEIGFAALESANISELVQSSVSALADRFAGTANIGERFEDRVIIIGRAVARSEIRHFLVENLRIGSTMAQDSALCRALSIEAPTQYTSRVYEHANQLSLAVPMPSVRGRSLSLGISTIRNALTTEQQQLEAVAILKTEAARIGRIIDLDPI